MLSRNLYKVKKTPLGEKRKKAIFSAILVFAIFFIIYGFYNFQKIKPENGQKQEIKVETGDRPLKKNESIFVNADGGLSLREDRSQTSKRIVIIPNKTKLEATEEIEGWYKVSFEGKEGWILKQYTTKDEPAQDPYKDWTAYNNTSYKIKYPLGWKVKDYGAIGSKSLVAFSNQDLPESVPEGTEFLAPIIFKISTKSVDEETKSLDSISGVVKETISVGGKVATKYVFTSMYSNTQMTSIIIPLGANPLILTEAGGYQDDLNNMIKTITF